MVEGKRGERRRLGRPALEAGEKRRAGNAAGDGAFPEMGNDDDTSDPRDPRGDLANLRQHVERSPPVVIAVAREEDLGSHLPQPVDDRGGSEIGGARRPRGAEPRRGESGRYRLGDVRQDPGHAVAGNDALGGEPGGDRGDLRREVVAGDLAAAPRFVSRDDRGAFRGRAREDVVREVEARARKPPGARHGVRALENWAAAGFAPHPAERPYRRPERLGRFHGPGVKRRIPVAAVPDALDESGQRCRRDARGRWGPHRSIEPHSKPPGHGPTRPPARSTAAFQSGPIRSSALK